MGIKITSKLRLTRQKLKCCLKGKKKENWLKKTNKYECQEENSGRKKRIKGKLGSLNGKRKGKKKRKRKLEKQMRKKSWQEKSRRPRRKRKEDSGKLSTNRDRRRNRRGRRRLP